MKDLMTIELRALRFFAYHGLYAEERKLGNDFEVSLSVSFLPSGVMTAITETINYVQLHTIVKKQMQQPRELLETLAMEIIECVHDSHPTIKKSSITITKLHPPIPEFTGTVGVTYEKEY